MSLFTSPGDYPRLKMVGSFDELVTAPFENGVNALCWPRMLPGNFCEVIEALGPGSGIMTVDEADLVDLCLSDVGRIARDVLLADQASLRAYELQPNLDCVHGSPRELDDGLFPTDVYSFHVDSATVAADTYLCTYAGETSQGLRNEEALRRVDIPETRAALLELYGGEDDPAFLEYLNEYFYDLHYLPVPSAQPFSFGLGNLWRLSTQHPGCPVPACIHRAPVTLPGHPSRLLLIS